MGIVVMQEESYDFIFVGVPFFLTVMMSLLPGLQVSRGWAGLLARLCERFGGYIYEMVHD